jgi:cystathionine beta-lyase
VAADDLPFAVLGATVAALTTGQSWLDALPGTLKMRRRQLGGLIAAQLPDVPWQPPQATYRAWLGCRHIGDGEQPRNVFPGRGRVALEPGPRLGTPGSGFVRPNFGTSEAALAGAIERIASALS